MRNLVRLRDRLRLGNPLRLKGPLHLGKPLHLSNPLMLGNLVVRNPLLRPTLRYREQSRTHQLYSAPAAAPVKTRTHPVCAEMP